MYAQTPFLLYVLALAVFGLPGYSPSYAQEPQSEKDATPVESEMVIELEKAVHFLTPQGEDVVVSSGTYTVESFKDLIRLKPSDEGEGKAVIVQAEATTHEKSIESPQPISVPGNEDQYGIMLLLPDGKAMQAIGSYSGVHTRGFKFKKGFKFPKGMFANLPKIKSIDIRPPGPPRPDPPKGAITPWGTLSIKGEKFGTPKGTVVLQVRVPREEYFTVSMKGGKRQKRLLGSKPGTMKVHLIVMSWRDDKIRARVPIISGVPDHSAVLQVLTAKGRPSIGRKVAFHAIRAVTGLKPYEAVTKVICSTAGDRNGCKGPTKGAQGKMGCLAFDKPIRRDTTISAWHVNCDRIVDWDEGIDIYFIELKLKNGWVINNLKWGMEENSGSDKVFLPKKKNVNQPDNKALTKRHKGRTTTMIRVPWKVSPGPDWVSYWIQIGVEGPAGTLFNNRVWWKK